jgi:hypothetical protein
MSTQYRFWDGSLDGSLYGEISTLLCDSFDGASELEGFVRDNLGRSVVNGISWNKALRYVCSDLVGHCERHSTIAKLLTALREAQPENVAVTEFVEKLVGKGILIVVPAQS